MQVECEKKVTSEIIKKDKVIEDLTQARDSLANDFHNSELVKCKDKEIHDIKKELSTVTENLSQVKAEFANFTSIVNKERKNNERKDKKNEKKEFLNQLRSESCPPSLQVLECYVKSENLVTL